MKATCYIALFYLMTMGIFACVYALTSFDLLLAICFFSTTVYRLLLSFAGVAALWLIFWLVAFRPFRPLS